MAHALPVAQRVPLGGRAVVGAAQVLARDAGEAGRADALPLVARALPRAVLRAEAQRAVVAAEARVARARRVRADALQVALPRALRRHAAVVARPPGVADARARRVAVALLAAVVGAGGADLPEHGGGAERRRHRREEREGEEAGLVVVNVVAGASGVGAAPLSGRRDSPLRRISAWSFQRRRSERAACVAPAPGQCVPKRPEIARYCPHVVPFAQHPTTSVWYAWLVFARVASHIESPQKCAPSLQLCSWKSRSPLVSASAAVL